MTELVKSGSVGGMVSNGCLYPEVISGASWAACTELAMAWRSAGDRDDRGTNGWRRSSAFWGLGCPKTHHEIEDTLV